MATLITQTAMSAIIANTAHFAITAQIAQGEISGQSGIELKTGELKTEKETKMITIAVANQKGGVGKSTVTREIASACALVGYKVLMIDCDPQGNLTNSWIDNLDEINPVSLANVLIRPTEKGSPMQPLTNALIATPLPNLDLVGTDYKLIALEKEPPSTVYRLKKELKENGQSYDLVFLDCPPHLGNALESALTAADWLLIPCAAAAMGLEGLSQLIYTTERIKSDVNPDLKILGALLNLYKTRRILASEAYKAVQARNDIVPYIFKQTLNDYSEIAEAPSYKLPVLVTAPSSKAAGQIREVMKEMLKRIDLPLKKSKSQKSKVKTKVA